MNTKKTERNRIFDIVNGPGRDALFDAYKYAYDDKTHIHIEFAVAIGYTTPVDDPGCAYVPMDIEDIKIRGIEHEDGSGYSFNLHGWCKADLGHGSKNAGLKSYKFKAYYNAKTREGCISFIS